MISPSSAEFVEKRDLHSIVWTINGLLYDDIHYKMKTHQSLKSLTVLKL